MRSVWGVVTDLDTVLAHAKYRSTLRTLPDSSVAEFCVCVALYDFKKFLTAANAMAHDDRFRLV